MTQIQFRKEKISVENIGRQRFWVSIIAGFITAGTVSLAVNHTREAYRFFTGMSPDLLILESNELLFFNYFYSTLAAVLGLSVTIWFWMNNNIHKRKKDRIYKQLSGASALAIFWLALMGVARYGSIISLSLYSLEIGRAHV